MQHIHVMINNSVFINSINHCCEISVHKGQLNSPNSKVYFYKHPKLEVKGKGWHFFLPQRSDRITHITIFQKPATCSYPLWDEKSLTFNFLKNQNKKNIGKEGFQAVL
jgi:hypothetical protein